jgi:surface protein
MASFIIKLDTAQLADINIMALPIYGFSSIEVDWGVTIGDVPIIYTYFSSGVTFIIAANSSVDSRDGFPRLYNDDEFIIKVTGDFTKFGAGTPPTGWNSLRLISIDQWGSAPIEDLSYACDGAVNLMSVPATLPSTVTNVSYMFNNATTFNGDISGWNTAAVTNMSYMFNNATTFNSDISGWNTGAVKNMEGMFQGAAAFNQNLSTWDTEAVENMKNMFYNATEFKGDISTWDTRAVTNMEGMFASATAFNGNISGWDTGAVTNMAGMFAGATAFNQNLSTWNTGAVTDMTYMFYNASAQYNNGLLKYNYRNWPLANGVISYQFLYIGGNNTTETDPYSPFSSVQPYMALTFTGNGDVTLPIEGDYTIDWGNGSSIGVNDPSGNPVAPGPVKITGTVTRFGNGPQTWIGADRLTIVARWGDVSGLVDLSGAFYGATNLTEVPTTLPSTVTNLSYMFAGATAFNGDISGWDTGAVTDMSVMFDEAMAFNGNISGWNTEFVENMSFMFAGAALFNQNLSTWDTEAVTNMAGMFYNAMAFTADLSGWAYKLGPVSAYDNFFTTTTFGMNGITDPTTESPRSPFYTGIPTPSNPYVSAASLVVFDTPPNPTIKVGAELFGTVGSVLYRLNHSYTSIADLSAGTFVGTLYRPYIANVSISDKIYGAHTGGKLISYDTVTRTLDLSAGTYQGTPTGYMALDSNGNLYSTDSSGYIYKLTYATTSFVVLNTTALLPPIIGPLSIVNNVTLYGCNSENRIVHMTILDVDSTAIETPPLTPPPAPTSLIVDSSGKPYYYDTSGYGLWTLYPPAKLHDFSGNPLDGTQPVGPIRMDPVKRVLYGICSTGGRGLGAGFRGAGTLFSFDLNTSVHTVLVNYVAGDVNRGETPLNFSITTEMGTAYLITRTSGTSYQTIAPRVANGYAVGSAQLPGVTTTCFNHGTKILSLMNDIEAWVPVENLNIGDLVMTYLHGPRPITHIFKGVMINNPAVWHTCMYKGQKAGFEPLLVTGGHGLLVDYLTEEEQAKQENFWGRNEVVIDDKIVMIAPVSAEFTQITDRDIYTYYHFVVENDGDNDRRYGVYANGFLTETPSKNQAVVLKYKDHPVY